MEHHTKYLLGESSLLGWEMLLLGDEMADCWKRYLIATFAKHYGWEFFWLVVGFCVSNLRQVVTSIPSSGM